MFDFRYHALSLAAVFIALVVGLLLGAAIGDKSVFTRAEQLKYDRALSSLTTARSTVSQLSGDLALRERYENDVYPTLVADELAGERIGLIFLGGDSNQIEQYVQSALAPSGAQLQYDVVVREPIELASIAAAATAGASATGASNSSSSTFVGATGATGAQTGASGIGRYGALASDAALVAPFAQTLGSELVSDRDGGPLLHAVQASVFSSTSGTLGPVAAVVLVRNEPSLTGAERAAAASFEDALAAGLAASGVPVVGVQLTDTTPSQLPWYSARQLTSVDDVDDIAGRTALVYALAGARGSYGIGTGAQSLLPGTLPTGVQGAK